MIKIFKKIANFIKKKECQEKNNAINKPDKISFYDEYYFIKGKQYKIINISTIYYGVDISDDKNIKYYIVLDFNTETYNTIFEQGFELVNIDYFINVIDKFNIPVVPTITNFGVYTIDEVILSIEYTCFIYEKYLVSIYESTLSKKNFSLDDISIEELLENPKKYMSSIVNDNKKFNIKILSKKITFNRGYGIYPVLNNEIIVDDIFYSFEEEEIKAKILELFKRYSTE